MPIDEKLCLRVIEDNLLAAKAYLASYLAAPDYHQPILQAITAMAKSLESRGRIYSCGNGGSMCDAMHFAEELSGRFRETRRAYAAIAISDPGYISCVANDFGYEQIFSRFLEGHGNPGDVLLAISTSGKSPNVVRAAQTAKSLGMKVIALTGNSNSGLHRDADIGIATPAHPYADRIQEVHIKIIHALIDGIEQSLR